MVEWAVSKACTWVTGVYVPQWALFSVLILVLGRNVVRFRHHKHLVKFS